DAVHALLDRVGRREVGKRRQSLLHLQLCHIPRAHPDEAVLAGQLVVRDWAVHGKSSEVGMNDCSVSVAEAAGEGKPAVHAMLGRDGRMHASRRTPSLPIHEITEGSPGPSIAHLAPRGSHSMPVTGFELMLRRPLANGKRFGSAGNEVGPYEE